MESVCCSREFDELIAAKRCKNSCDQSRIPATSTEPPRGSQTLDAWMSGETALRIGTIKKSTVEVARKPFRSSRVCVRFSWARDT